MRTCFRILSSALSAILLPGCAAVSQTASEIGFSLPYFYRLAPAAAGTVLDARTGLPIAGARIRTTTPQDHHESLGVTDEAGQFEVDEIRLRNPLNFKRVGFEPGPWPWIIQVNADGYRPYFQRLETANDVDSWDFGEIRLEAE